MRRAGRWALIAACAGFWYFAFLYLSLPDVRPLRTTNPEATAFMALRADQARADGRRVVRRQRWVPYGRISSQLTRAVLVAEDAAFWQHEGVDFEQLKESFEVNFERLQFARGASTITQQLAKNLYLSPSKNPTRKLRELMIARRLEAELSKRRILEIYLNVIEWGNGVYGADAAARAYFGKTAAGLDATESALLAAAIINPRTLDPGHPSPRLRRRQRMILRRMGDVTPPSDAPAGTPIVAPPAGADAPDPGQQERPEEVPPGSGMPPEREMSPSGRSTRGPEAPITRKGGVAGTR